MLPSYITYLKMSSTLIASYTVFHLLFKSTSCFFLGAKACCARHLGWHRLYYSFLRVSNGTGDLCGVAAGMAWFRRALTVPSEARRHFVWLGLPALWHSHSNVHSIQYYQVLVLLFSPLFKGVGGSKPSKVFRLCIRNDASGIMQRYAKEEIHEITRR